MIDVIGTSSKNPTCMKPPSFLVHIAQYVLPLHWYKSLEFDCLYSKMHKVIIPIGSSTFHDRATKADKVCVRRRSFTSMSPLYGRPLTRKIAKICPTQSSSTNQLPPINASKKWIILMPHSVANGMPNSSPVTQLNKMELVELPREPAIGFHIAHS